MIVQFSSGSRAIVRAVFAVAVGLAVVPPAPAAITVVGDVVPVPPAAGGNVAGTLRVGSASFGSMSISGATALTSSTGIIGDGASAIGVVTLSGLGSDWGITATGGDLIVGNNGTGNITVASVAKLTVADDLLIGSGSNSQGKATITGLGSAAVIGDTVRVGSGVLDVLTGGRVSATGSVAVGDQSGSDGRVTIANDFSLLQSAQMIIGNGGVGAMLIADGGRAVTAGSLSSGVGAGAGAAGYVEVNGVGSTWEVSGGLIVGLAAHGQMLMTAGGRLQCESGTIGNGASGSGEVTVQGSGSRWDLSGNLFIASLGGEGELVIADSATVFAGGGVTVVRGGRVELAGGRLEAFGGGLINNGMIRGSGVVESTSIVNNALGTIRTSAGDELRLSILSNSGLVDLAGGELSIGSATTNSGEITARDATLRFGSGLTNNVNAQLIVTGGTVDVFGNVTNNAGGQIIVGGTSTAVFHDTLTNNGQLVVGADATLLTLANLGFSAGAGLDVALQSTDPTDIFGRVESGGASALAGTLALDAAPGFAPPYLQSLEILHAAGGVAGNFQTVLGVALAPTRYLAVTYDADSVFVTAALPGDANLDGTVNIGDFAALASNFNRPGVWTNGDFNGAGGVEIGDFALLATNFNLSLPADAPRVVPELSSVALCFVAGAGLLRRAQRT